MNISSTRRQVLPQISQNQGSGQAEDSTSPEPKGATFSDSVTVSSRYVAGGAGAIAGIIAGTKASIDAAFYLGISNATYLFLAGVAIGGGAGAMIGYHGAELAGNITGNLAKKVGASNAAGRTIGATAVSAVMGAALTGSATGALLGAGAALGGGGIVYASHRADPN